ncbi:MAG: aromatic amino acid lyase, partial [Candidatus Thorarchaeota archaeon]|nr:aromatic amino acid lyase [Candidatus Thorarchaeota archaeon]
MRKESLKINIGTVYLYYYTQVDTMIVAIDGESLTIDDVVQVARNNKKVELAVSAIEQIKKSRDVIDNAIKEGRTVYGVNTGFGDLASVSIGPEDLAKLQVNLIRSHSVGVGEPFPIDVVRGMMLLRANALAKGYSGIRFEVIITLIEMLNAGVTPVVPQQGSVGSSGDLAPLAHMALVLIGEGEAFYKGKRMEGLEALKK